uniref:NAC domain-containing protein n=1 Tax=Leersia perrieri TaxID=77586 RepID=A0A0D9W107_9ORYZ
MAGTIKGLVFSPTDNQLTDVYLRRYLLRLDDLPSSCFHVADVYSASPDRLLANLAPAPGTGNGDDGDGDDRVWYVPTPVRLLGGKIARRRKDRTVVGDGGGGCWRAEGWAEDVRGSAGGGRMQKLSYYRAEYSGGGGIKREWIMVEYSLPGSEHLVALCKLYRSPRYSRYITPPSMTSSPSTSVASGSKRKADQEEADHRDAPACSVRRQNPPPDAGQETAEPFC